MPRFHAKTNEPVCDKSKARKGGKVQRKKGLHYKQHHDSREKGYCFVCLYNFSFFSSRKSQYEKLPGCVTSQGSVITSPTANLKASDLDINIGSFLFTT